MEHTNSPSDNHHTDSSSESVKVAGLASKVLALLLIILLLLMWGSVFYLILKKLMYASILFKFSFVLAAIGFTIIGLVVSQRIHPDVLRINWSKVTLAVVIPILTIYIFLPAILFLADFDDIYLATLKLSPGKTISDVKKYAPTLRILNGKEGMYRVEVSKRDAITLSRKMVAIIPIQGPKERMFVEKINAMPAGTPNPQIEEMIRMVSQDSLMRSIRTLENFGTRVENSPQEDSAAAYLTQTFQQYGLEVEPFRFETRKPDCLDMNIIDSKTLLILMDGNDLYSSRNGGETFTCLEGKNSPPLCKISFATTQIGFSVGMDGKIYKTTNEGKLWTTQKMDPTLVPLDLKCLNSDRCIVIGRNGIIQLTVNGGKEWKRINSGVDMELSTLEYIGNNILWIPCASGILLRSTDTGVTWSKLASGVAVNLYTIHFWDQNNGTITGDNSTVLKTTDGGMTWKTFEITLKGRIPADVYFIDSVRGLLIRKGYPSGVSETSDGGKSWQDVSPPLRYIQRWIRYKDSLIAGYGFYGSVLISNNRGQSWSSLGSKLLSPTRPLSKNICATLRGSENPDIVSIIVGHYDSAAKDVPGANDNATGVAAVMEAARICSKYRFNHTIKFLAVAAEELGLVGSRYYAEYAREQGMNINAVVNGDMLGYPILNDPARISLSTSPPWSPLLDSALILNRRYNLNFTLDAHLERYGGSDHASFLQMGYQALEISEGTAMEIWGGLDPYYHKPADTAGKLDPQLVQNCTRMMLALLVEMAKPLPGKALSGLKKESSR
ncbi:MAG: M20/M25/M40 family metallo-hydrolase [bacterium]